MKSLLAACLALLLAPACTERKDDASQVHDLRVLGVSTESPELMAPSCEASLEALAVLSSEVTYRALVVDPRDAARSIHYELFACSAAPDALCDPDTEKVKLAEGDTTPGELTLSLHPGTTLLPDGTPLLQKVRERDPYQGLGGARMPLVLHLTAGEEQVWASKLMVFNCPLVPGMEQNHTPVLPGLSLEGEEWHDEVLPVLRGPGPFKIAALDYTDRVEHYVVPSFKLEPVPLTEVWKVAWHATLGKLGPTESGGTDLNGQPERNESEWTPPSDATEQEVTFWAVVRDGRGGESWLMRRARWVP